MAIEKSMLDSYTNGYKFYVDDLKSKNITGKHYDEVESLYNRILELGEQCSDINDFNAQMQNEKISERISGAYSQAITGNINMPKPGLNAGIGVASGIAGMAAMSGSRIASDRQFLDFVLLQYLSGGRQVCLHVCGDEFLGCHHVIDGPQHIFLETEVAIRHDAHQMLLFVHHGYAADVIFVHELQRILHAASALYRYGVVNHAVLGAFYNGNLARLLFDTHVFMYDTDAAFARNCDSHRRFRDGIHRSRNEGNLKFDVA